MPELLAQLSGQASYPDVLNNALNVLQTIALAYLAIHAQRNGKGPTDG